MFDIDLGLGLPFLIFTLVRDQPVSLLSISEWVSIGMPKTKSVSLRYKRDQLNFVSGKLYPRRSSIYSVYFQFNTKGNENCSAREIWIGLTRNIIDCYNFICKDKIPVSRFFRLLVSDIY